LLFIYLLVLIFFYGVLPLPETLDVTTILVDKAFAVLYGASPTKLPSDIPLDTPLAVVPTPFTKAPTGIPVLVPLFVPFSSATIQLFPSKELFSPNCHQETRLEYAE
jgi:hypothetical protein